MTIDKALRGIYKLGGIVLLHSTQNRSKIAKKCNAIFYCHLSNDRYILYIHNKDGWPDRTIRNRVKDYMQNAGIPTTINGSSSLSIDEIQ